MAVSRKGVLVRHTHEPGSSHPPPTSTLTPWPTSSCHFQAILSTVGSEKLVHRNNNAHQSKVKKKVSAPFEPIRPSSTNIKKRKRPDGTRLEDRLTNISPTLLDRTIRPSRRAEEHPRLKDERADEELEGFVERFGEAREGSWFGRETRRGREVSLELFLLHSTSSQKYPATSYPFMHA